MIDWLSSKVAISIAVLILVSSVAGFMALQRESALDDEVRRHAEMAANWIDSFGSLGGESEAMMSIGEGGMYCLPSSVGGEPVYLNLSMGVVRLRCGARIASASYIAEVHLWEPKGTNYTWEEIDASDAQHPWTGWLGAGDAVIFERIFVSISGSWVLITFAYHQKMAA
ncbi:MAG: hypothetical protein AB1665_02265 [Candidatus Thermoplasmatota archaeon]